VLCSRLDLVAGCLLGFLDQTAKELTKRSYVLANTRGFERLQVTVATLNRNDSGREDVLHKEIVLASELAGRTDMSWARERADRYRCAVDLAVRAPAPRE